MAVLFHACLYSSVAVRLGLSEATFSTPSRLLRNHNHNHHQLDRSVPHDRVEVVVASNGMVELAAEPEAEDASHHYDNETNTSYTYQQVCDSCDCSHTDVMGLRGNVTLLECEWFCNNDTSCSYVNYWGKDKDCWSCAKTGWSQKAAPDGTHIIYEKHVNGNGAGEEIDEDVEPCPEGFLQLNGDLPLVRLASDGDLAVDNVHDCAVHCYQKLYCLSFEYSPTTQKCFLNKESQPTDPPYDDYNFCVKIQEFGNGTDNGTNISVAD